MEHSTELVPIPMQTKDKINSEMHRLASLLLEVENELQQNPGINRLQTTARITLVFPRPSLWLSPGDKTKYLIEVMNPAPGGAISEQFVVMYGTIFLRHGNPAG